MYKNSPSRNQSKTSSCVTSEIIESMSIEPNDIIDYLKKNTMFIVF